MDFTEVIRIFIIVVRIGSRSSPSSSFVTLSLSFLYLLLLCQVIDDDTYILSVFKEIVLKRQAVETEIRLTQQ